MAPRPIPEQTPELWGRFESYISDDHSTDCWLWTGPKFRQGYGAFSLGRQVYRAHRVIFAWMYGDTTEELDHLCHDPTQCEGGFGCPHRACVNPEHLQVVSSRENVLRGSGPTARNAVATHCVHGHEFTPENTYIDARGWRSCKACRRRVAAERVQRDRERINARRREIRKRIIHEPRECLVSDCSNIFTPKRVDGRFCSPACYQRARHRGEV